MRRRSFLKAVAAVAPAAGLQTFLVTQARSQTPAAPRSREVHVVGAGEDRSGQPHSLGFSSILFKVPTSETAGGLFVMEHTHLLPGGPPLHLHLYQEEWFYVMEGEVAFQVGEQRIHLHEGESVLAPRLVPHTFSSVGSTPGRLLIAFCPAGKMEQYFRDVEMPKRPRAMRHLCGDMKWRWLVLLRFGRHKPRQASARAISRLHCSIRPH